MTVAVTGLDDNLTTESKANAQKEANNSRLAKANQLNKRDGRYHYRHNRYRPYKVKLRKSITFFQLYKATELH